MVHNGGGGFIIIQQTNAVRYSELHETGRATKVVALFLNALVFRRRSAKVSIVSGSVFVTER